jgi:hypothetical protein
MTKPNKDEKKKVNRVSNGFYPTLLKRIEELGTQLNDQTLYRKVRYRYVEFSL